MSNKIIYKLASFSHLMIASLLLTNCSQINQNITSFNLYSTEEEIQFGYKISKQYDQQLTLNTNPEIVSYINDIGQKLVKVSKRSSVPFVFKVVDDPSVNAFALPGGFCYINTGLILFADTESELASVIGHEIAHVVGEHSMKRLSKTRALNSVLQVGSILGSIFIGQETTENALMIADLASTGVLLNYSRGDELEADRLGLQQMHDAGLNPIGSQSFFQKLSKKDGGNSAGFFSTHPATDDRFKQAKRLINNLPKKDYEPLSNSRFEKVKKILSKK
ncbi:MAG: M48 family metallopeptidase [Candidatus Neomarinimicrobiota bacterium]|tara:strand:+ start:129 stop:959 length:831 start_codon:yes stop_codon:yes gene_type:complete